MDAHTLMDPRVIDSLAWECPTCHSRVIVQKGEPKEDLLSIGCSVCTGIRPVETAKGTPIKTDFRDVFYQLQEWSERGIRFVLTEE